MPSAVRKLLDHACGAPTEVRDQSNVRMSAPISPPPARNPYALGTSLITFDYLIAAGTASSGDSMVCDRAPYGIDLERAIRLGLRRAAWRQRCRGSIARQ